MFLDGWLPAASWWSSIAHERKQSPIQGAHQKARGVKAGLPDVLVLAPGFVLGVELKAGKNTATAIQNAVGAELRRLGHGYEIVRSVEQLGEVLIRHGFALGPGWQLAAQRHDAALDAPAKPRGRRAARLSSEKPALQTIARGNRLALAAIGGRE